MTDPFAFNTKYPSIPHLREKAKSRIPKFAFDYLDGGCNEGVNLKRNTEIIRNTLLHPNYLSEFAGTSLKTELFGHVYDAPFGIAPIGLQGLIWPNAPQILAKLAHKANIPFILSTVSTENMETIAQLTEGRAWFQLYHPAKATLRNDLIDRAKAIGCPVLVLLCDVPSFGIRHMEIKNGLALPPRISARNIWQILQKTKWAWATLKQGSPSFKNLTPYMPKNQSLKQLGRFMDQTFDGRLDRDKIAAIRDMWPGKLVLKGVATQSDAEMAIELGIDGLLVSNHGGRQLDAAEATVESLDRILTDFKGKLPLMMDSGIRSGADIGRTLAHGADFTFLGRSFMYAVAALGQQGGDQAYTILKRELEQLMTQVGCPRPKELPKFTIPN